MVVECVFPGCDKPRRTAKQEYCGGHYQQVRRGKELTPLRVKPSNTGWVDGYKVCPGCGENKSEDEYYNNVRGVNGKASRCKTCCDVTSKEWQAKNYDSYIEAKRRWREENEGHQYKDSAGYVMHIGFEHPASTPSGVTRHHRVVLWDTIGPGEHKCYWCGTTVSWFKSYPKDKDALVVDHLNGIRDDNRPENLVPSCQSCNSGPRKKEVTNHGPYRATTTINQN